MSRIEAEIRTLDGEIAKGTEVLQRLGERLQDYETSRLIGRKPGSEEAMVVAHLLSSYYTCAETIFLRISRFFENSLPPETWHQALLDKMTLSIEQVRPAVICEEQRRHLMELLKFRHFTRYYFELDYDWDKLHFLLKKFHQIHPTLNASLNRFREHLQRMLRDEA